MRSSVDGNRVSSFAYSEPTTHYVYSNLHSVHPISFVSRSALASYPGPRLDLPLMQVLAGLLADGFALVLSPDPTLSRGETVW